MFLINFFIYFVIGIATCRSTRVCTTFEGYCTNVGCSDNADTDRNVTEIIRNWGFTAEEYNVTTLDGYQILVVRGYNTITQSTPIILGHGIYMNSLGFVSSGNKTLAYQAIEAGFQVFLVNYRGTRYSLVAGNLTQDDRAYWNYSFHEMGIYDLPGVTELVYTMTGLKALYVGYSMGTTISYIYSSVNSTHASERLTGIISMAPVATLNNVKSILGFLAPLWPIIKPVVNIIWNGKVLPRSERFGRFCASTPGTMFLCETFFKVPFFGYDYQEVDPLWRPVSDILNSDTIAIDVVTHFSQIILSGRFQEFDHGSAKNLQLYGSIIPPEYNVTNIPVKVAVFVGPNDWIATPENAVHLYENLANSSRCGYSYVQWSNWDHTDFVTSINLYNYLNSFVLTKIQDMQANICI